MLPSLFLAAQLWSASPALATSVIALDPVEQAADSTAIVVAVVGDATPGWDARGEQVLDTALTVEQVLAGSAPAQLAIRQIKGVRPDGARLFVIGDAELAPGERVVAFVRLDGDGHWYLTALNQSVWHVQPNGAVHRSFDGLELFQNTERGVVPANESPRTFDRLDELVRAVRGLPCEEAGR